MANDRAMRSCQKTACRWPAAASLSYRYDTRQVWLQDLSEESDPSLYDLCPHHADALVVMRGWTRVDQRTHADPVVEPAGRDLLPESGRPPVGAGGYGGNRYTELVEDLPRLAALLAEDVAEDDGSETEARGEAPERAGTGPVAVPAEGAAPAPPTAPTALPVPSRDLAPLPAAEPSPTPPADPAEAVDEVPGQLAIPVPTEEPEIGEAVVVSISEATARRRTPATR